VTTLRPFVLAAPPAQRELQGPERVAAQSAHARVALARSADATGARLGALEKGEHDAPLPSAGWHWSIAHTAAFSAGVVARQPVGVDVEAIAARRQDVVPRVAKRDELDLLGGFRWETFFRVWTAKEAVLKKAGCGILELSRCTLVAAPSCDLLVLSHRGREHAVHLLARSGHVAAVACDGEYSVEWTFDPVPEVAR
jgi:4'-phosphopantetheinyl transferase